MSYAIRPLAEEDGPRLVAFLRRFFLRDEHLNAAAGVVAGGRGSCPEQERFLLDAVAQGVSLQAVAADSGEMVGVMVSRLHRTGHREEAAACPDPAFREVLRFIAFVDLQVSEKLAVLFPDVHRHRLEIIAGSVSSAARGKGVGVSLVKHTEELAKERGIPLVRVDCSSVFSAKGVEHCGFQKIFSIRYSSYRRDGKVLFPPTEDSGDEYITYVKRVIPRQNAANIKCQI